jgi:RHS repeat-associated protein
MSGFLKQASALFLNFALLANQVGADLQKVTFEAAEWVPGQSIGGFPDWSLQHGTAVVSANGDGNAGGKSLRIPAGLEDQTHVRRSITWDDIEPTAFVDFLIKPSAEAGGSLASVHVNGTQLAFLKNPSGAAGAVWVYAGNDSSAIPEAWRETSATFGLNAAGTASNRYLRVTLRQDYIRDIWDIFVDGNLVAANLGFEGRQGFLSSIDFFNGIASDNFIDDLQALPGNMLFPDADKDGLPDAWEIANGSNPNLYDRDAIRPGTSKSFVESYMESLAGGGAIINGTVIVPAPATVQPLSLPGHAPVGALKGSLSVGSDGGANYSMPIDIPKGTAGMEPKLSINYSSGGGNGPLGLGWSLGGLQTITRGPSSVAKDGAYDPMDFDASDAFFLDGQRLMLVDAEKKEYRTEIDSYARITAVGTGPFWWKVETRSGLMMWFGNTEDSKIADARGPVSWGLTRVRDSVGNYYTVSYARDSGAGFDVVNHRVAQIQYTGRMLGQDVTSQPLNQPYCSIDFTYEVRPDKRRIYGGALARFTGKRLSRIRVLTGSHVNHAYRFAYETSHQTGRSLLKSVTKHIGDQDGVAHQVPPTVFQYDGLKASDGAIWAGVEASPLSEYGTNLDSSGEVNSVVVGSGDPGMIRLYGDVSRAYRLPTHLTNVQPNTWITFEFKSTKLNAGAIFGLEKDMQYGNGTGCVLCRIGGSGNIAMGGGVNFSGPNRDYSFADDWRTYWWNIGNVVTGSFPYLVMMCADNESSDGQDNASFRNVKIYTTPAGSPSNTPPLEFNLATELPRYTNSQGKDLGVAWMDLDSDGLTDFADWRVVDYTAGTGSPPQLLASTFGHTFRNNGDAFEVDSYIRPPVELPLGCRAADDKAYDYATRHHLLAQPIDIDSDGMLDLLASDYPRSSSGHIRSVYSFFTLKSGSWSRRAGMDLPFRSQNITTSEDRGGVRRDHHFAFADMDNDGYQDLLVHTTNKGQLIDRSTEQVMVNTNVSAAFRNLGPGNGWSRNWNWYLPTPLMEFGKDYGRRLIDINGDGQLDIVEASEFPNGSKPTTRKWFHLSEGTGDRWVTKNNNVENHDVRYALPSSLVNTNNLPYGTILADLNGDGIPDVIRRNEGEASFVRLNQAERGSSPWVVENPPADNSISPSNYSIPFPLHFHNGGGKTPYGFEMADLNGDGLVDILYSDTDSTTRPGPDDVVLLNTGDGWDSRANWGLGSVRIYNTNEDRAAGRRYVALQDINCDGFPDIINGVCGGYPRVRYNRCKPEVLTSVTDGFGSTLQVDYRRLNDPRVSEVFGVPVYTKGGIMPAGHSAIIDSRLVVSRYSAPNGLGGTHWTYMRYEDLRYDITNATSLGFRIIVKYDQASRQRVTTTNHTEYPFAGSPLEIITEVEKTGSDTDRVPNAGTGWKKLIHESATYSEISSTDGIRRPGQTGGLKLNYDPQGYLAGRTKTNQTFDSMGFVTSSTVSFLDDSEVATTNTYIHHEGTTWHLGRLSKSLVTKSRAGETSITRESTFGYYGNGLLRKETVEPEDTLSSSKEYFYDSFGNIVRTEATASGQTRKSYAAYDSKGRFVTSETNILNQLVSHQFDDDRALLTSTTDANGLVTRFQYDTFGTRTLTLHPDGTRTGEATGYVNSANPLPVAISANLNGMIPIFFRATQTSGGPVAKVWLDMLGREVATETTLLADAAASGSSRHRTVYTVSAHNWRGQKSKISQPFALGETPRFTFFAYDYLFNIIKTTHPDNSFDEVNRIEIGFVDGGPCNHTTSTSRNGQTLERWTDQHGRLVQSRDASGKYTHFKHDLDGRLVQVTLDGQILLTNKFDLFGNKTEVWEANSGTSKSTYNGFGEVVSAENARGQITSTTYDLLGRVATVTRPDGEGTYTYHYDTAPGAGVGQLHYVTGPDGYRDEIAYDHRGRPVRSFTARPNPDDGPSGRLETFTAFTTYDGLGRVHTSTDAGRLTTLHEYDSLTSAPLSLRIGPGTPGAGTLLWKAGTYDSEGKPLTQTLAHGITRSASYYPLTGLIDTLGATMGGQAIQSLDVHWETNGNLQSRADLVSGKSETFTYDTLNRLTSATITGGPSSGYSYDIKGNLLAKPGAALAYAGTRPHAVTSATLKGAAHTYQYDAAGHMTGDLVGGTLRRSFAWTSYGQLRRLDYTAAPALHRLNGTLAYGPADVRCDFLHDASGGRYLQRKNRTAPDASRVTEETLYLGSYERERHFTGTSSIPERTVHRHSIGGFAVYTRTVESTGSVTRLSSILKDHLGSSDVIITGRWVSTTFGEIRTERQSFDPWGERRNPTTLALFRQTDTDSFRTSTEDHDRGYTGHEQLDDSGLIHMNGRIYDPELGRMLSPDPFVQIPEYSQNFNRYSYVLNNPLNKTDPSGYSWLSEAFDKVGDWLSENWRTVVVIIVVAIVTWGVGTAFVGAAGTTGSAFATAGTAATATTAATAGTLTTLGMAATGAIAGGVGGGLGAALAGGDMGDVLKGALVGGIQGALIGGMGGGAMDAFNAGNYGLSGAYVVGHGVVGGAANRAMGGKFQDGFISAATSAAAQMIPFGNGSSVKGAVKAGVVGGTASALGGGKFSNGAWTAAFQYILSDSSLARQGGEFDETALKYAGDVYGTTDGGLLSEFGINYQQDYNKAGFGAALYQENDHYYLAMRGTNLTSGANWWANIKQALGFRTAQYNMAVELANFVYRRTGGNVTFVGHSLGAGLASAAAYATGGNAVTFNAAGLSWRYRIGTPGPGRITANYIRGDVLSLGQDFTILPSAAGNRLSFAGTGGVLARHGWDQFN